jgi:hypothetical protein
LDEVCLLGLGRIKSDLIPLIQSGQSSFFDMSTVFERIVGRAIKCNDFPLLQGRALWFAGQYAEILPPSMSNSFLTGCIEALKSSNCSPVVYVFALKAICSFCNSLSKELLVPFQLQLMESLAKWMTVASDETLILLLETLTLVVKVHKFDTGLQ